MLQAIILADGDAPTRADLDAAWPGWDDGAGLVVAADGGARHAPALRLPIDVWVGDGDSIDASSLAAMAADGVVVERSRPDKDESDTELAVRAALSRGATRLTIIGALGGTRIDHAMANVGLLALAELTDRVAVLIDAESRMSLIRAPGKDGAAVRRVLPGRSGDLVSLLPVGSGVSGVTTTGLAYPLVDEALPLGPSRGLSNVRAAGEVTVVLRRGLLLVVESPARLQP